MGLNHENNGEGRKSRDTLPLTILESLLLLDLCWQAGQTSSSEQKYSPYRPKYFLVMTAKYVATWFTFYAISEKVRTPQHTTVWVFQVKASCKKFLIIDKKIHHQPNYTTELSFDYFGSFIHMYSRIHLEHRKKRKQKNNKKFWFLWFDNNVG